MENLLNHVLIGIAVLFMFSASIFVHEFGHFLVARWRRMKIEEFAIGCGPKIFSRTRNGILYSLRVSPIPIGGFVKLPQMVTSEAVEGKSEPVPPAPPLSKILVAFAGPLMNAIFAFAIATVIYFVGLPVLVNPSVIGYVDPESPEGKMGIRQGDKIVAINGKPVSSWEEVNTITALAPTNVFKVTIERDGVTTNHVLTARAHESIGLKWLNLDPYQRPVVGAVEPGMPAEQAGLKKGDHFLSFDGVPVISQEHLIELVKKSEGKLSEVVVEREGQRLTLHVTPKYDPKTQRGRMGIVFAGGVYQVVRPGPLPWEQFASVWNKTIGALVAVMHSSQTGVRASDFSGPVGILAAMAVETKTDYRLALKFLVLLNVSLAFLNLLPVPVLDGGHILLAVIEAVWRRPLNPRIVEYATNVFGILIISFVLYVTFFDFRRLPLLKAMFDRDVHVQEVVAPPPGLATNPAPAESVR
jgi:regulator of sigma E protease